MEDSSLKTVLPTPEETEEPYSKKFKIDSNQVIFERGQQQLFEICNEDNKSANKFLCFPKTWNFSQHNLELREKSSTILKNSVRQHANFKMFMNAKLQSRLLENIPYIGKWPSNSCTTLRNGSCKLKKNNSDFIQLESLVSYAKESETATKTNMSKTNEWPTRGIIFYIILAEKFIARIESLFGDVPEFQNKEKNPGCCHAYKMLQSEEQHLISKPVRSYENSDKEVLKFCFPFKYFMNGKKSDFESLNYEYKNILHKNNDILSYKKQRRFYRRKNFRRNKIFRHTYTLYSKKCGINLKLTKGIAFELFLQSKGTYHYTSCSTKQKGEDSREEHFSSETNRRDQFELVLEELRMFNEISKANENSLSQTEINILEKESHVLNCSDNIPDQVNRNINPVISTTDITMSCTSGVKQNSYTKSSFHQNIQFGEQEIPHNYSSNLSDEELFCSSSEKRAHCKQSFSWNPAFVSQTFTKEGSYNLTTERGNCLLSGIIRIQPLKTCCGPLRVGLSRKAKLKQLHPYLK
ncbi:RAD51-associated protein 2 [Notechis scutatus]|uniref:RAD51-associated protein 2 n=1 Tax=Notechis scutatus TaxID=8663 RepID=A0A6J1UKF5_9SAUR|nr:RAD51-associated protein 2 [Notechis scutatus]